MGKVSVYEKIVIENLNKREEVKIQKIHEYPSHINYISRVYFISCYGELMKERALISFTIFDVYHSLASDAR